MVAMAGGLLFAVSAYLPWAYCQEGRKLAVEYFGETYPVEVAAIGYKPLYDPENLKPRS